MNPPSSKPIPSQSTTVRPSRAGSPARRKSRMGVVGGIAEGLPFALTPLLARLFATPRRFARPDAERQQLRGATSRPLLPGIKSWQWGPDERPAVLLVHGWEGRGSQLGHFVAPLLDAGFRVLTFDALAHGSSRGKTATIVDFAQGVEALAASVDHPHAIVAHSFGGTAVNLALLRGLKVNTAVYLAPPANVDLGFGLFIRALRLGPRAVRALRRRLTDRIGYSFHDFRVSRTGQKMRVPLLLLHDQDDRAVPVTHAAAYGNYWPNATVKVTQGLGHRKILEDRATIAQVTQFVKDALPRSARADLDRWYHHSLNPSAGNG